MGALYHLKQKLVDFCNVIQENVSRTDTVPSSKVVYDLKADTDSQISDLNDSLNNKIQIGYLPNATTGTTGSSGQYISNSIDVTFSRPFGSTPSVILQEAGGNASRAYAYRINAVTKTGFSFWVVANTASYQPPAGSWIAIAN